MIQNSWKNNLQDLKFLASEGTQPMKMNARMINMVTKSILIREWLIVAENFDKEENWLKIWVVLNL